MVNKIASLLLSTYIAALIYQNAFFIKTLTVLEGADQLFWNNLGILIILLVVVYFFVHRYVSMPYSRGSTRHLRGFALFVAFLGLLLALLYHVVPLEPVYNLPDMVDMVFASDLAYTLWLILPLLVLFI